MNPYMPSFASRGRAFGNSGSRCFNRPPGANVLNRPQSELLDYSHGSRWPPGVDDGQHGQEWSGNQTASYQDRQIFSYEEYDEEGDKNYSVRRSEQFRHGRSIMDHGRRFNSASVTRWFGNRGREGQGMGNQWNRASATADIKHRQGGLLKTPVIAKSWPTETPVGRKTGPLKKQVGNKPCLLKDPVGLTPNVLQNPQKKKAHSCQQRPYSTAPLLGSSSNVLRPVVSSSHADSVKLKQTQAVESSANSSTCVDTVKPKQAPVAGAGTATNTPVQRYQENPSVQEVQATPLKPSHLLDKSGAGSDVEKMKTTVSANSSANDKGSAEETNREKDPAATSPSRMGLRRGLASCLQNLMGSEENNSAENKKQTAKLEEPKNITPKYEPAEDIKAEPSAGPNDQNSVKEIPKNILTQSRTGNSESGDEKQNKTDDESMEDTSYCDVCKVQFASAEQYFKHTRGLMHTQKQMEYDNQKNKDKGITEEHVAAQDTSTSDDNIPFSFGSQKYKPKWNTDKPALGKGFGDKKFQKAPPSNKRANYDSKKTWPQAQQHYQIDYGYREVVDEGFDQGGYSEHGNFQEYDSEEKYEEEEEGKSLKWAENYLKKFGITSEMLQEANLEKKKALEKDLRPEDLGKKQFPPEFHCKLCDAKCTSGSTFQSHLQGAKHRANVEALSKGEAPCFVKKKKSFDYPYWKRKSKIMKILENVTEPLIGLQYITEFQKADPKAVVFCVCNLCEAKCDEKTVKFHVIGLKHRTNYMQEHHKDFYEHFKRFKDKKPQQAEAAQELAAEIEKVDGRGQVNLKFEPEEQPVRVPSGPFPLIDLNVSGKADSSSIPYYPETFRRKYQGKEPTKFEFGDSYNDNRFDEQPEYKKQYGGRTVTRDRHLESQDEGQGSQYYHSEGYSNDYGRDYGHGRDRFGHNDPYSEPSGEYSGNRPGYKKPDAGRTVTADRYPESQDDGQGSQYYHNDGYSKEYGHGRDRFEHDDPYNRPRDKLGQTVAPDRYPESQGEGQGSQYYHNDGYSKDYGRDDGHGRDRFENDDSYSGNHLDDQSGHKKPDVGRKVTSDRYPESQGEGQDSQYYHNEGYSKGYGREYGHGRERYSYGKDQLQQRDSKLQKFDAALYPARSRVDDLPVDPADYNILKRDFERERLERVRYYDDLIERKRMRFSQDYMHGLAPDKTYKFEEESKTDWNLHGTSDRSPDSLPVPKVSQELSKISGSAPMVSLKAETCPAKSSDQNVGPIASNVVPAVQDILSSLSSSLITTEDEAAVALQVSNALTQALLSYRLKSMPEEFGKSSPQNPTKAEKRKPDTSLESSGCCTAPQTSLVSTTVGMATQTPSASATVQQSPGRIPTTPQEILAQSQPTESSFWDHYGQSTGSPELFSTGTNSETFDGINSGIFPRSVSGTFTGANSEISTANFSSPQGVPLPVAPPLVSRQYQHHLQVTRAALQMFQPPPLPSFNPPLPPLPPPIPPPPPPPPPPSSTYKNP